MAETREWSGIMPNGNHFLIYKNKANSLISGNNCMPIPIPTSDYTKIILHDSRPYGKELNDLSELFKTPDRGNAKGSRAIEIEYVGSYAYIKGHISSIREMAEMAEIELSEELETFYITNYSGWSIVFAVWSGDVDVTNEPCHIEYPADMFPGELTIFMNDGHGELPEIGYRDTDHVILISIPGAKSGLLDRNGKPLPLKTYSDELLEKIPNLNPDLYGIEINWNCANGDLWIDLDGVKNGHSIERILNDSQNEDDEDKTVYSGIIFTPNRYGKNIYG